MDQNKFPSTLFSFPCHFYRPQRSCGQGNVFTGVCDSVHRGRVSASVHVGIPHSPGSRHPPLEQTPPWEQTPPQSRHNPLEQTPPWEQTPPPQEAGSGIRSISGRYASYWNAFLFFKNNSLLDQLYPSLKWIFGGLTTKFRTFLGRRKAAWPSAKLVI